LVIGSAIRTVGLVIENDHRMLLLSRTYGALDSVLVGKRSAARYPSFHQTVSSAAPMSTAIEHVTMQLAQLPQERVEEDAHFIDFIATREHDHRLVRAAQAVSEASLATLWTNETDAAYDRL
jgi:hypothetical protein